MMEQELRERLIELETSHKERWENHNKTADSRHKENAARLDKIFGWLEGLDCKTHKAQMNGFRKDVAWLWRVVYGVIIIGLGLGVYVRFLFQ